MAAGLGRTLWIGGGTAVAVLLLAVVWWDARHPRQLRATPDLRDATRIAAGRSIYAAHCASCHGANLEGQPDWTTRRPNGRLPAPPHDDSGHTWHHPNAMLFAITKHGLMPPHAPTGYESDMPAFAGVLGDDDIWNVLAFIQSRWSDRVRSAHAESERAQRNPR
jgi:mono/diheme cytochrome c family protein